MSDEQKPGDPADRVIDAKADGAFGGAHSHRAGYGGIEFEGQTYTKLEWVERTARMGGTLAAGEGRMLVQENDRLREQLRDTDTKVFHLEEKLAWAERERDQLTSLPAERILAALRAPSTKVLCAALAAFNNAPFPSHTPRLISALLAAVEATEQEVGRE